MKYLKRQPKQRTSIREFIDRSAKLQELANEALTGAGVPLRTPTHYGKSLPMVAVCCETEEVGGFEVWNVVCNDAERAAELEPLVVEAIDSRFAEVP